MERIIEIDSLDELDRAAEAVIEELGIGFCYGHFVNLLLTCNCGYWVGVREG